MLGDRWEFIPNLYLGGIAFNFSNFDQWVAGNFVAGQIAKLYE